MSELANAQLKRGYCWVVNDIHVDCQLPIEIISDCLLRKASDGETERILEFLVAVGKAQMPWHQLEHQAGGHLERLPRDKWRYYVIEPQKDGLIVAGGINHDIEEASRLTEIELHCNVFAMGPNLSLGYMFQSGFDPFACLCFGPQTRHVLTREVVGDINNLDKRIKSRKAEFQYLAHAFEMFRQASYMPDGDRLTVLAQFAVLESLVTHDPIGAHDSLGHQLSTKIPLLDMRMKKRIDYSDFQDAKQSVVWKRLYECRSRIAHGGKIDFNGSLQVLGNLRSVTRFLRNVIKQLLRQALDEPELIRDLRFC